MQFKVGNTIVVLDDNIKGKVTKIHDNTIFILSEDGMIFEFLKSEVVKIDKEQSELSMSSNLNNNFLREKTSSTQKKKSAFKKTKNEVIMEVDLHIEKLVKSTWKMDNFDILTQQIDTARFKVEYCIQKRIPKLVLIHGVGDGVLKAELHNLLNRYSINYYDASYQRYGLGATEVKIC